MKDHVEIDHLTKYHAFRVNRDQVMDLEIWLKIHTNVSNFETASPKLNIVTVFYSVKAAKLDRPQMRANEELQ